VYEYARGKDWRQANGRFDWAPDDPAKLPEDVYQLFTDHFYGCFIKDDFAWITGSRVDGLEDVLALFARHNGFYRPMVSLSFALGSSASRTPSPRTFSDNTVSRIMMPGAIATHGRL